MPDFLADLEGWSAWLLSVGAAIALVAGFWKWVLPKYRAGKEDLRAIRDTLVGREATRDSITGAEIAPPIPGIGARMSQQEQHAASMERQMTILTSAVSDMANNQSRLDSLERRVSDLEQGTHFERLASKAENIRLYSAMEAIARDEDPTRPEK